MEEEKKGYYSHQCWVVFLDSDFDKPCIMTAENEAELIEKLEKNGRRYMRYFNVRKAEQALRMKSHLEKFSEAYHEDKL